MMNIVDAKEQVKRRQQKVRDNAERNKAEKETRNLGREFRKHETKIQCDLVKWRQRDEDKILRAEERKGLREYKKTLHATLVREKYEGASKDFFIEGNVKFPALKRFLDATKPIVKKLLFEHIPSKLLLRIECTFMRQDNAMGEIMRQRHPLSTKPHAIVQPEDVDVAWNFYREKILKLDFHFTILIRVSAKSTIRHVTRQYAYKYSFFRQ